MTSTSIISILIVLMILRREMRARPSSLEIVKTTARFRAASFAFFIVGGVLLLIPILFRHISARDSEWFPEMGVAMFICGLIFLFVAGRRERTAKTLEEPK